MREVDLGGNSLERNVGSICWRNFWEVYVGSISGSYDWVVLLGRVFRKYLWKVYLGGKSDVFLGGICGTYF